MTDLTDFQRLVHDPMAERHGIVCGALGRIRRAVRDAALHTQQPVNLNYVAIPKDDWERIVALAEASSSSRLFGGRDG